MRSLIIAPHADDEVLGCGNYMLKNKCDVLLMCVGDYKNYLGQDLKREDKIEEIKKCHKYLGVENTFYFSDKEGLLDTIPESEIVKYLDQLLLNNYDRIFYPYPSRHIDHRVTYNSVNAALRLREGKKMEKEVYIYEYPFVRHSDHIKGGSTYLECTKEDVSKKVEAFMFYKSQTKKIPSPLNSDGIFTLARMRGMEMGLEYAEKYYLQSNIL